MLQDDLLEHLQLADDPGRILQYLVRGADETVVTLVVAHDHQDFTELVDTLKVKGELQNLNPGGLRAVQEDDLIGP